MTQNELRETIKSGNTAGVYLFCGEEEYLKRHYLGELRRLLVPDEGIAPFVHFSFDGEKIDLDLLREAVASPAMFGGKLIEWHGATLEGMKEKEISELESFVSETADDGESTVVIIATAEGLDTGTEKRPSKLFSRLGRMLRAVPFYHSTDSALLSWIRRHLAAEGLSYAADVPSAILARVGHDMMRLDSEIEKLAAYAKQNAITSLTEKEVSYVCIRTVESDAFSLTNALLDGKVEDAYAYLGDMKLRRVDPLAILGQVSRLYADLLSVAILAEEGSTEKEIAGLLGMHEYKAGLYLRSARRAGAAALEERLSLCNKIDAELKSGVSSYRGLEQLIAFSGTAK